MKNFFLLLLILFALVGATTNRTGWSYSGENNFTIIVGANAKLFHDQKKTFSYESKPNNEEPVFNNYLEPGKYVLTIEGYYYLELEH